MKDVIIKDIKRKTTIPEDIIVRAAKIANGLPVTVAKKVTNKQKSTQQLQKAI